MKRALVIGATGLVGRALVDQLLATSYYSEVMLFVRRPSGRTHGKLIEHLVDFEHPDRYAPQVRGDVLFSALGTTARQAGSRAAQYRVDHDYQWQFASAARVNGVPRLVLVSAAGASSHSPIFYSRMKGQLEKELQDLGFRQLHLLQPSFLDGERERYRPGQDRPSERLGIAATKLVNRLGLFSEWRPIPAATVAKAMIQASLLEGPPSVRIWKPPMLFALAAEPTPSGL